MERATVGDLWRVQEKAELVGGAPVFAVEIRSKGDCGPAAEARLAAKRADYFAAGTLVVWDVDNPASRLGARLSRSGFDESFRAPAR